jgi:outer membrane murein-binding lipoprotein Lpp
MHHRFLAPQSFLPLVLAAFGMALQAGCYSPSKANIDLRKQNQELQAKIDDLNRRHEADEAAIRGLQARATTVPSLPENQLDQLYTVAGLKFGSLTGGYHDDNENADTMLKVYVCPIDQAGDKLKAAGTFHVELFDLALKSDNRIGSWEFDAQKARDCWFGQGLLYTYVLDCPWQTPPVDQKLMARITYDDLLTHRTFTVDKGVSVQPPAH